MRGFKYSQPANRSALVVKIKAKMVWFWSRWRDTKGLDSEQIKTVEAERKAFTNQLADGLMGLDSTVPAVASAFSRVMEELNREPHDMPMPNALGLVDRVARKLVPATSDHECAECARGHTSCGGEPAVTWQPQKAVVLWRPGGEWLCHLHYEAVTWVANRSRFWREGKDFPYPPPWVVSGGTGIVYEQAVQYVHETYLVAPLTEKPTIREDEV